MSSQKHKQRAHSKFSASGAERWFACPGSVELSEGVPDKETEWSKEGTLAHEVLEEIMKVMATNNQQVHKVLNILLPNLQNNLFDYKRENTYAVLSKPEKMTEAQARALEVLMR